MATLADQPIHEEDNFQFSYHWLLDFLSQAGQQGYIFARADDQRFIPGINANLIKDLAEKSIKAAAIFLRTDTDEPIMHQIEQTAADVQALIIANLFEIIKETDEGFSLLTQLNFGRERLWALHIPILFWADERSMYLIANDAPDLYSQRRLSTVHITGMMNMQVADKLKSREGWDAFLSSKEFNDLETHINILEKRLAGAKEAGYVAARILAEIVVPLAMAYAQLGFTEKTKELLGEYAIALSETEDATVLSKIAEAHYALHDYDKALELLAKAIHCIRQQNGNTDDMPYEYYESVKTLVDWSTEIEEDEFMLEMLETAVKELDKSRQKKPTLPQDTMYVALIGLLAGRLIKQQNNHQEALVLYKRALEIAQGFVNKYSKYPDAPQVLKVYLNIPLQGIGDILMMQGNVADAAEYYKRGLENAQALSKSDDSFIVHYEHDLTVFLGKMVDALVAQGKPNEARVYTHQKLDIAQNRSRNNPHIEDVQRDLAVAHFDYAVIYQLEKKVDAALKHFRIAQSILQKLSAANPLSQKLATDCAVVQSRIEALSLAHP